MGFFSTLKGAGWVSRSADAWTNMARTAATRAEGFMGRYANSLIGTGTGGMAGKAAHWGATAMKRGRGLSNATLLGATAGGVYGAMSDDTSVLGGMLMGGAMGGVGRAGMRRYDVLRRFGVGRGQAAAGAARGLARISGRHVKSGINKGYTRVMSSLKG